MARINQGLSQGRSASASLRTVLGGQELSGGRDRIDLGRRALLAALPMLPATAKAQQASSEVIKEMLVNDVGGPVPVWRWPGRGAGVIAFSHGAASAPWKYQGMIGPWVAAGYEVLGPLHVDSPDHPNHASVTGAAVWRARLEDMRTVSKRINGPYIAAGHSFGALTALVLGGVSAHRPDGFTAPLRDPAARCAVAFSPPPPIPGLIELEGYSTLAVPALIETGTHDLPPKTVDKVNGWKGHLAAYEAAVPGRHRYGLVLDDVDHYFGGAICDFAQPGPPQTAQLDVAVRMTEAFMADWGGPSAQAQAQMTPYLSDQGPARLWVK